MLWFLLILLLLLLCGYRRIYLVCVWIFGFNGTSTIEGVLRWWWKQTSDPPSFLQIVD